MPSQGSRRIRWIGTAPAPELRKALSEAGFELLADPQAPADLRILCLSGDRDTLEDELAPQVAAGREGPLVVSDPEPGTLRAVLSMRRGAWWYLGPTATRAELAALAESLESQHPVPKRTERGSIAGPDPKDPVPDLVGVSTCIANVKELVRAAARTESPVFVTGPSGTGKELVARSIHRLSPRVRGPFVPVNCGALPESLAEAELFGAEKGAFTGALVERAGLVQAAAGGTLFLDEIGEMPVELQVKLLRVLQERAVRKVGGLREVPVDVRIVAATNRDPLEAVRSGTLREDLYYRLAVLRIRLDPLRARPEDVAPLVESFLAKLAERYASGPVRIADEALERLVAYPWPGNVRELWNALDLIFALGRAKDRIEIEHLPDEIRNLEPQPAPDPEGTDPERVDEPGAKAGTTLREAELALIRRALARSGGNKAKAARALGISRPALYRRLEELGLA